MSENAFGTNSNILMELQANFVKQQQTIFLKPQNKEQVICHNIRPGLFMPAQREISAWILLDTSQQNTTNKQPFRCKQRSIFSEKSC